MQAATSKPAAAAPAPAPVANKAIMPPDLVYNCLIVVGAFLFAIGLTRSVPMAAVFALMLFVVL